MVRRCVFWHYYEESYANLAYLQSKFMSKIPVLGLKNCSSSLEQLYFCNVKLGLDFKPIIHLRVIDNVDNCAVCCKYPIYNYIICTLNHEIGPSWAGTRWNVLLNYASHTVVLICRNCHSQQMFRNCQRKKTDQTGPPFSYSRHPPVTHSPKLP